MQSFKEYLAEETRVEPVRPIILQIKLRGDGYISAKYGDRNKLFQISKIIIRELNERCEKANIPKVKEVYHFASDRVTFHLALEPNTHYSKAQLDTIEVKFIEIANEYEVYNNNFQTVTSEVPAVVLVENFDRTTTVEVNHVILEETVKSLHDIHKVVLSAKQITMGDSSYVERNVLGLLKIKNATIYASVKSKWFDIVLGHFKSGKNVLACQEDLIDAGLKDYAEL